MSYIPDGTYKYQYIFGPVKINETKFPSTYALSVPKAI
jgi:hypothetical protein